MDRVSSAAAARTIAWEARDSASMASAAGQFTDAEVWHDLADAADDLAVMIERIEQHITDHG